MGKFVTVDLSTREIIQSELRDTEVRKFLGGRGVNISLLSKNIGPDSDPLGPGNVLVLSCGLLTGTDAPASARLHVSAHSPLTGIMGSSNVGGHFGAALRKAGVDTLLIRGRARHPSMLWVDGENVALHDAEHLWGLETRPTSEKLQAEFGRTARFMVIGPGGENQVPYACVMTGTRHAAGRTGMGAVMGSKNLKAIGVRGGTWRQEKNEATRQAVREYQQRIMTAPRYETYARFSNSAYAVWSNEMGMMGTRNYQHVQFSGAADIDGTRLIDYVTRPRACSRCPVHCKAEIEIRDGPYAGTRGERPDIDPIVGLGARCGLDDPEALLYLYNLGGDLGIDVISTAGVLAFGMELYERGIISQEDTEGIELSWGNARAMEAMMKRIARREGFGDVLAEGVRRAADIIGRGASAYAYHVKGLELAGYDPRGAMGTALGYAVSTRGGDFANVYCVPEFRWEPEQGKAWFGTEKSVDRLSVEGKGQLVRRSMIVAAVLDALGLCKVPVLSVVGDFSLEHEAELVSALTGWDVTAEELAVAGERVINAEKLFNLRQGAGRKDDDLPDRFTEERVGDSGPTFGMTVDIQKMVKGFYAAMGWDEEGVPEPEKLKELDLEDLAQT
jgi:aldehyde:ferredoxin oxidoreductase